MTISQFHQESSLFYIYIFLSVTISFIIIVTTTFTIIVTITITFIVIFIVTTVIVSHNDLLLFDK